MRLRVALVALAVSVLLTGITSLLFVNINPNITIVFSDQSNILLNSIVVTVNSKVAHPRSLNGKLVYESKGTIGSNKITVSGSYFIKQSKLIEAEAFSSREVEFEIISLSDAMIATQEFGGSADDYADLRFFNSYTWMVFIDQTPGRDRAVTVAEYSRDLEEWVARADGTDITEESLLQYSPAPELIFYLEEIQL